MNLIPFDELNTFRQMVTDYKAADASVSPERKRQLRDDLWEYIEYLLIEAYVYGNVQAMQDLGLLDLDPADLIDRTTMFDTINEKIADKTWRDRIEEYLAKEDSTVEDFMRVAETDATRIYNEGVLNGGRNSGKDGVMKQWRTMEDEKVRDAHIWLDGVTVPLGEKFYVDGDGAMAPGGFSDPALNVNCRCELTLIYRE